MRGPADTGVPNPGDAPRATGTRRVCIVGAGFAQRYARAFACDPSAEVVGVCARTIAGASQLAATVGARPYTDLDEMLEAESADIVVVAAPNHLHHPVTMAALRAGAEVICEKPLALTTAQAEEMTSLAAALGRRTRTSFTWRFLPACIALKSLLASGALGDLYHVELRYLTRGFGAVHGPMRWQYERAAAGSGALANLGSHAIDLVHWWFGDIGRVAALTRTVIPFRTTPSGETAAVSVDDVCTATYELAGGAPVALTVGWVAHVARVALEVEVHGSAASAWLRFATGDGAGAMGQLMFCDETMRSPGVLEVVDEGGEDWADLGQACVSRLVAGFLGRDGGQFASPEFVDGLRAQCVADATLAASESRSWVDVAYAVASRRRLSAEPAPESAA